MTPVSHDVADAMVHRPPAARPDEIADLVERLSNWGRWGPSDELGTLNALTPERRLAAMSTPRAGRSVSLARRLAPKPTADAPRPLLHLMLRTGAEAPSHGFWSVSDWIGLDFHGFGVTHLDALCHVMWDGTTYNGRPGAEIGGARGAPHNNVESLRNGIVARAALFDVPRLLGRRWLEPGEAVGSALLDHAEQQLDEPLRPGDALLLRFGRDARAREHGAIDPITDGSPGLLAEALDWVYRRDLSLIGSDTATDVMTPGGAPHQMPIHVATLVAMGVHLLDNAALEELAVACDEAARWEMCLSIAPLVIQNGTGSPVNPIAVL
jgi:hypothetical protein